MVQVKICGICSAGDAQDAVDAGADLLGFHFCSSPRRIEPELARSIVAMLDRRPTIVGVFIDQPAAEVRQIAEHVGLDLLQLHGSEAPGFDAGRSEEHTSELQSHVNLVCRLLLEKKK